MEAIKNTSPLAKTFIVSVGLHFTLVMHFNHCMAQDFKIVL